MTLRAWACLALLVLIRGEASAAPSLELPAPIAAALAESGIPPEHVGLYMQEVGKVAPLLEWNAAQPMNPASTMKLLTTLAGLELLGPAYTWRTEAYLRGSLADGVLDGDLVLKGYGDPRLDLGRLSLLLRELRMRGLRDIRGDLVLDRSFFAHRATDPGRFDNEPTRPYNVLPDALLINLKSVRLQFVPNEAASRTDIFATPALPEVDVVNRLVLGVGSCDVRPDRPQVVPEQARLVFTGVFPAGCGEHERDFALLTPDQYALSLFGQLWRELGGTFSGRVREAEAPRDAAPVIAWESPPLAEVIRDINKFSNNVMARQLFLTLATVAAPPPATIDGATRAVRAWLARSAIDAPELVLENGAGLSRVERISTRSLARVLMHGFNGPLMPEFVASLPILGTDGTLRARLNDSTAAGQAHIKTGYLEGVRAIAGYVRDQTGRWIVVVSVINHSGPIAAQGFQDAVIEWVYQHEATRDSSPRPVCCGGAPGDRSGPGHGAAVP